MSTVNSSLARLPQFDVRFETTIDRYKHNNRRDNASCSAILCAHFAYRDKTHITEITALVPPPPIDLIGYESSEKRYLVRKLGTKKKSIIFSTAEQFIRADRRCRGG